MPAVLLITCLQAWLGLLQELQPSQGSCILACCSWEASLSSVLEHLHPQSRSGNAQALRARGQSIDALSPQRLKSGKKCFMYTYSLKPASLIALMYQVCSKMKSVADAVCGFHGPNSALCKVGHPESVLPEAMTELLPWT